MTQALSSKQSLQVSFHMAIPENELVITDNWEEFVRKNCIVLKLHRKCNVSAAIDEENLLSENISSQKAKEFLKLYKII